MVKMQGMRAQATQTSAPTTTSSLLSKASSTDRMPYWRSARPRSACRFALPGTYGGALHGRPHRLSPAAAPPPQATVSPGGPLWCNAPHEPHLCRTFSHGGSHALGSDVVIDATYNTQAQAQLFLLMQLLFDRCYRCYCD